MNVCLGRTAGKPLADGVRQTRDGFGALECLLVRAEPLDLEFPEEDQGHIAHTGPIRRAGSKEARDNFGQATNKKSESEKVAE